MCFGLKRLTSLAVCPIIRERIMGRGFAPPRRFAAPPLPCLGGRSPPPEPASPVSPPSLASRVTSAALLKALRRIDCYFWDAALVRPQRRSATWFGLLS